MESSKLESLGGWSKCFRGFQLRGFQLRIFGFGYCAKRKTRNENLGKLILQGFPVFRELRVSDLVERFRGLEQCLGGFSKAERWLKNFGGAWEGTEKIGGEILGGALREDSLGLCLICFEVNVSVNSKCMIKIFRGGKGWWMGWG